MTDERNTNEMRELLGAYALDALDPDERAKVDAYLLTDPTAAELHELEHAAAWLGHASLRPPANAWDAIAAEVARDLEADELVPVATTPDPMPESEPALAPVTSISAAPAAGRRNRGARWLIAAAVAVIALGATAGVVTLADRTTEPTDVTAQQARDALQDGSASLTTLRSTDGRWSAWVVLLPDKTGYLKPHVMPKPEAGHDLQLWSITPDGPVSAGVIHGSGPWHEFQAADATTAIAVTEEPRGGSQFPTGDPIVTGAV